MPSSPPAPRLCPMNSSHGQGPKWLTFNGSVVWGRKPWRCQLLSEGVSLFCQTKHRPAPSDIKSIFCKNGTSLRRAFVVLVCETHIRVYDKRIPSAGRPLFGKPTAFPVILAYAPQDSSVHRSVLAQAAAGAGTQPDGNAAIAGSS